MSQNSRKFNRPKLGFLLGLAIALVIPTLAASSPAAPPKPTTRTTEEFRCQKMYGNSAENYDNLITIGKRTEEPTSRFYISSSNPRSITCKIIKNPGELKLAYGLPDNSNLIRVSVKIYMDGELKKTLDFGRGEAMRESIDIMGASGYTIDYKVILPKNESGYIYMLPKS
ncbi:MAG: hypothetical protein P2A85_20165 [Microcoleus anatoxicus]|uniref:hypothetical protein n=1 Tax=Microcoleus anatoxicus TaxID=2705319 RepID=UPI003671FC8E